jgi:hypothetical protein
MQVASSVNELPGFAWGSAFNGENILKFRVGRVHQVIFLQISLMASAFCHGLNPKS